MKKKISIEVTEITALDAHNGPFSKLWDAALLAAKNAYAPYSQFHVGAACITSSGRLFTGANQENAAYPSGLCAERVCVFHAGYTLGREPIVAMAVAAVRNGHVVAGAAPCGACRQVLLEYECKQNHPMELLWRANSDRWQIVHSISDLLPFRFDQNSLMA